MAKQRKILSHQDGSTEELTFSLAELNPVVKCSNDEVTNMSCKEQPAGQLFSPV
jgi:hypothetical protein